MTDKHALTRRPDGSVPAPRADLLEDAVRYHEAADSESTRRTYRVALEDFAAWCELQGREAMPAEVATVAAYLTDRARTLKVASLEVRKAAIARLHRDRGLESPTEAPAIRRLMRGIRREKGTAPCRARPAELDDVRRMVQALPEGAIGARDRALLLLGFAGALRRSELVGLDVEHLQFRDEGVVITLSRSKTDQEGAGMEKGIPYGRREATCPVRALATWLEVGGITEGPVFRPVTKGGSIRDARLSDRAVALVVKKRAAAAGIDPDGLSGHSLRAGFATSAAAAGVPEHAIQAQTGHRSVAVLRGYVRHGSLFRQNAAAALDM